MVLVSYWPMHSRSIKLTEILSLNETQQVSPILEVIEWVSPGRSKIWGLKSSLVTATLTPPFPPVKASKTPLKNVLGYGEVWKFLNKMS